MNKIEALKAEKDGLDILRDIPDFAQQGWEAISEADLERLKWSGVFFRKHTPGFFMMRVRITNGISDAIQLRTLAGIAAEFGRGRLDITTRQQIQLRWLRIEDIPDGLGPAEGGWPHQPPDRHGQHSQHYWLPGRRADAHRAVRRLPRGAAIHRHVRGR